VKFCMRVGLLSGQVFPPFGEDWLAGSHGGGGISRRPGVDRRIMLVIIHGTSRSWIGSLCSCHPWLRWSVGIENCRRRRCLRRYGGVCVLQPCWRTCLLLFYFSLSSFLIRSVFFLLLSITSLPTRIVPLCFQAGGHRKRPNLGLVCLCLFCVVYFLVKDYGCFFVVFGLV